jgi:hypothetical protein
VSRLLNGIVRVNRSLQVDEPRFWSLIELAWQPVAEAGEFRRHLAGRKLTWEQSKELRSPLRAFVQALQQELDQLPPEELLAFDPILERKLYDLDRAEVHRYTNGSDDGFLYARGFIVAAGQAYYEAVHANPSLAVRDVECEEMCFLAERLYREKFGAAPRSGISKGTGSNKAGWSRKAGPGD